MTARTKFYKNGLLTELDVHTIEHKLQEYFGGIRSKCIIVPNVSFGFFKYESDLLVVTPTGKLIELEIKRSWSDFIADFDKKVYHDDPRVNYFYYCVPALMEKQTLEELDRRELSQTGVLIYDRSSVVRARTAKQRSKSSLDSQDLFKLCRLANMRFWSRTPDQKLQNRVIYLESLVTEYKATYKAVTGYDITD